MIHTADWYIIFVFSCSLLGLALSGILFFANRNATFQARLLAGFLTSLSLVGLNNALMATHFYSNMPHLWRAISFASFLPGPFSYLYVRSVLNQEYRFRQSDWWFFMPALVYVLSMLPFYLEPAAVKLELINRIVQDNDLIAQEPENIIPGGASTLARVVYGIGTTVAMALLLRKWKKRIEAEKKYAGQNLPFYQWLILFTIVVASFYLVVFWVILSHLTHWLSVWELVAFIISLTVLFICISLLSRPAILYGMKGWLQPAEAETATPQQLPTAISEPRAEGTNRKNTLTPEQGRELKHIIESHLATNQPFLKPNYKLADLGAETNIPVYLVSAFINQEYGKNFNEFINDYRIDHLFHLLETDKAPFEHYTLEALGRQAGFNSRNAFIASVKRKTGKTPSECFGLKEA